MLDLKPTHILAADQLARYVRPIALGDPPYLFQRVDETGRLFNLGDDYASGGYLVLVFIPDLLSDVVRGEIEAFERRAAAFEAANAKTVFITAQSSARVNREAKRALNLSFPTLADPGGFAFAAYGLHKRGTTLTPTQMRSVVITHYRRIRCYWDIEMTKNHAAKAEAVIKDAKLADEAAWTAPHPPVLVVPQVFSPEECKTIIQEFESGGELEVVPSHRSRPKDSFKTPVYEYDRQDRVDHVIADAKLTGFIDQRLRDRVFPEIQRAFAFKVTRRESLAIARYVGARSGVEIGHRDNRSGSFHRRFALSVGLNEDYDGGAIVFREFSNRGYRLTAGAALVFSSSLLHEVEEITKGVRYNLLSHFFNEASAAEAGQR